MLLMSIVRSRIDEDEPHIVTVLNVQGKDNLLVLAKQELVPVTGRTVPSVSNRVRLSHSRAYLICENLT